MEATKIYKIWEYQVTQLTGTASSLISIFSLSYCVIFVTMQRQSLGSPGSKLHHAHGGGGPKDDSLILDDGPKRPKDILAFSAASASEDFDDNKATKPHRQSSPPPATPDRVIHVIPVLTVLCFLILFLFSHTPSQSGTPSLSFNQLPLLFWKQTPHRPIFAPFSDLAQFNGFTRLPAAKRIGTMPIAILSFSDCFFRVRVGN